MPVPQTTRVLTLTRDEIARINRQERDYIEYAIAMGWTDYAGSSIQKPRINRRHNHAVHGPKRDYLFAHHVRRYEEWADEQAYASLRFVRTRD